jgi:hypothetical protein
MGELFDDRFAQQDAIGEEEETLEFDGEIPMPPVMVGNLNQLLQLGELNDEFEFLGHQFNIRTMRIGEELAALAVIKGYQDVPLAQGRAYATAMVAGALVSIDGNPLVASLSPGDRSNAAVKFKKVAKLHYYVIDYLYKRYTDLEKEQARILDELQARLTPEEQDADEPVEELSESPV